MPENNFLFKKDLLIIGNQAADLDSSVSAFALAELLKQLNPDLTVYPVIQGSPEDLRLKPEIESLFKRAEYTLEKDNFSEIFFTPVSEYSTLPIILVDHNKADREESAHPVAGIVDHHQDSGDSPHLQLRDIRSCGSCASIIAEYWEQSGQRQPYGVCLLLAGAIAVDTGYLDRDWGKTTDLDRYQYERLTAILKEEDKMFIQDLLHIKNDLTHLNIHDQLRRDYKNFPLVSINGGISSIPMGQMEFFRENFYEEKTVCEFSDLNCPDFLLIMHTIPSPFKRELSLYTENRDIAEILKKALENLKTPGLKIIESPGYMKKIRENWILFSQENIKVSRKVLVPLLMEKLENNKDIK